VRLTGCDHPNCPQRTTRATSTPRGIRTLDLLLAMRRIAHWTTISAAISLVGSTPF